jgi:predicted nucleic acid-binding Zn ribbon protein
MPIFEYACRACRHEFETLALDKKLSVFAAQKGNEAAPAPCGACGHPGGPGSCALN